VDQEVLETPKEEGRCEVEGGVGASGETLRRITCDAPVLEVPHLVEDHHCAGSKGGGCKLELGRSRRRAGAALSRAVRQRDDGVCCFPGCESRHYLHLHHLEHWAEGGETNLDNLCLLCGAHHRAVHEGGFGVARGEDGALCFYSPTGHALSQRPDPFTLPSRPVDALVAHNEEVVSSPITWETGLPFWDGIYPVDYGLAVDGLLRLPPS